MNIDLGLDGHFSLTLPSGRKLSVPNTPFAAQFLYKLLWDAEHNVVHERGYIGSYPTQAAVDAWLRKEATARRQRTFDATGIDVAELGINI